MLEGAQEYETLNEGGQLPAGDAPEMMFIPWASPDSRPGPVLPT